MLIKNKYQNMYLLTMLSLRGGVKYKLTSLTYTIFLLFIWHDMFFISGKVTGCYYQLSTFVMKNYPVPAMCVF